MLKDYLQRAGVASKHAAAAFDWGKRFEVGGSDYNHKQNKEKTTMRNSLLTGVFGLVLGLIISTAFTHAAPITGQGQTPNMQVAGQAVGPVELQTVAAADAPGEIRHAIDNLNEAKGHLDRAGGEWGGHKSQAIAFVNNALHELNLGVEWAHQHGTY